MRIARTAVALSALAITVSLALAPITHSPAWATITLGAFLTVEIIALWMLAREADQ